MTNQQKNIDARDALTYRIERQGAITPANLRVRLIEEFPRQLAFLFEPHPYKIAWSGRYAQKSWSFAAAILALGMERPLRVVCLRETMKSLDESVHTLMEVQIKRLVLQRYYRVLTSEIRERMERESSMRDCAALRPTRSRAWKAAISFGSKKAKAYPNNPG